ncbi:MAG: hypothetical protein U1E36_00225 [Rickettsiales bacterium]
MPKSKTQSSPVFTDEWSKWEDRVTHIVYDVMVKHPKDAASSRACQQYNKFKEAITHIISRGSLLGGPTPDRWTPVRDALLRYVFDQMSIRIRHHGLVAKPEKLAEKVGMLDNQLCNHSFKPGSSRIKIDSAECQQMADEIMAALDAKIIEKFGPFVPRQPTAAERILSERARPGTPDLP